MGWDIIAYFDIDQNELDHLIKNNDIKINKNECISKHFENIFLNLPICYFWKKNCNIHELYSIYSVNFIRDDYRFKNRIFHTELEKRIGKQFPSCLFAICTTISTRNDALEIAEALTTFFKDDTYLMDFAEWLRQTAKYCSTYKLSY